MLFQVSFVLYGTNVILSVDDYGVPASITSLSFNFGEYAHNRDVFVGGLPEWLRNATLANPASKDLPSFAGRYFLIVFHQYFWSIRNVTYRTIPSDLPVMQQPHPIESLGVVKPYHLVEWFWSTIPYFIYRLCTQNSTIWNTSTLHKLLIDFILYDTNLFTICALPWPCVSHGKLILEIYDGRSRDNWNHDITKSH